MTTFDQEWTGLKHDAATRMRLAGTGGEGGGPGGTLRNTKNAWTTASEAVGGLRDGLRKAKRDFEAGQKGTGAGGSVGGLESAAAQRELYSSWEAYVEAVDGRCGELSGKLDKAGNHHYKNDEATEAAFRHTATKVEQPDRPGGAHGGGR